MVTPIKYTFSESLLNKDSNEGFCLHHIAHNKPRQHFVYNYDVAQLWVYLRTHLHESQHFYVEFDLHILLEKAVSQIFLILLH